MLPEWAKGLEKRRRELEDARRRSTELGRDADIVVVSGAPADVLVEEAKKRGADLIVVGRRGQRCGTTRNGLREREGRPNGTVQRAHRALTT